MQKNSDFSKFMVYPHGKGGEGSLVSADILRTRGDILRTRGGGQFFAIFCGRPLWTAPYRITNKRTGNS